MSNTEPRPASTEHPVELVKRILVADDRIDCVFSYRGKRTITIPVKPNPNGATDLEPARKEAAALFWRART